MSGAIEADGANVWPNMYATTKGVCYVEVRRPGSG